MGEPCQEHSIGPTVKAHELDDFFRDLRQTILDLEKAYSKGELSNRLKELDLATRFGPALARAYRNLAKKTGRPRDRDGRRLKTVHDLLSQIKEDLFDITTWYHADLIKSKPGVSTHKAQNHTEASTAVDTTGDDKPTAQIRIDWNQSFLVGDEHSDRVPMRLDQILAARNWGIGFVFDDQDMTDQLVGLMTIRVLRKFARDLEDLRSLLPRLLRYSSHKFPQLVPPRSGRAFEQLIADILNEPAQHAALAGLCEDYLQKTDLRVQYSNLDRNRGARVQVTIASTEENHCKKVDSIRHPEQFVILSPWSLATAVPQLGDPDGKEKRERLGDDLIGQFWDSLPSHPADVADLSRTIKKILTDAIDAPITDPRGPMINVPTPIRQLIQKWVHYESFRSTQALRVREATEGRYRRSHDGRLKLQRLSETSLSKSSLEFIRNHPTHSRVRAVVKRIAAHAAWVEFADDLLGRIDQKELSWSDAKPDLNRYLKVGQEYEFTVRRVSARRLPAVIELSLKRSFDDPWQQETLRTLAQERIVQAKLVRIVKTGLLLEVAHDMIGRLNHEKLPSQYVEHPEQYFTIGQSIPVTIEAIDLQGRKMDLDLADGEVPPKTSA